jgi:hypothetical protein
MALPSEEVEWFTTTAFNHAVDCHSAGRKQASRLWANSSLELVHYCCDGGILEKVIREKIRGIGLGD